VSHIIDEQGKDVTFATKDAFVQGGGVIHSINAVSMFDAAGSYWILWLP
jgi:hypothetical protein